MSSLGALTSNRRGWTNPCPFQATACTGDSPAQTTQPLSSSPRQATTFYKTTHAPQILFLLFLSASFLHTITKHIHLHHHYSSSSFSSPSFSFSSNTTPQHHTNIDRTRRPTKRKRPTASPPTREPSDTQTDQTIQAKLTGENPSPRPTFDTVPLASGLRTSCAPKEPGEVSSEA